MIVVLKVEGIRKNTNEGELRKFFSGRNSRPEDIHLVFPPHWETGLAFLAYYDQKAADNGLRVDGERFKNEQISVVRSDETEFKDFLPDKQLITNFLPGGPSYCAVIKVEGLHSQTTLSEIRKHFKQRNARPDNIHLVSDGKQTFSIGTAFLIILERGGLEKALKVDGSVLRDNVITVKESNTAEFRQYLPHTPLLQEHMIYGKSMGKPFLGFLKVDGFDFDVRPGDLRRFFCEVGGRPEDIHLILDKNNKHVGAAMMIFEKENLFEVAKSADGKQFRGRKLTVLVSNAKEFDFYFPHIKHHSKVDEEHQRHGFPGSHNSRDDSYHRDRHGGRESSEGRRYRDRSRSPIRNNLLQPIMQPPNQSFSPPVQPRDPNLPGVDPALFLTMLGLPSNVSATEVVNYFMPITVHDLYIMRYATATNECRIVVEFFTREFANKAFNTKNGLYINNALVNLFYSNSEDISRALNIKNASPTIALQKPVSDGNQVQNLLGLLTATVTAMASQQQPQQPAATSNLLFQDSNVNTNDRERGCIVGIRNLSHSVTTEDILRFFHGFHAIADSVRIHRSGDGSCSGEAVISFRNNIDAVNAVNALHGRLMGQKRLDLFNLTSV